MHGTTLAILAASSHEFAERETRGSAGEFNFNLLWFVPGYLAASLIHLLFNQLPDRPLLAMLGASMFAPLAILAIFQFGTKEAQQWLESERGQHRAELEALRAAKWPEGVHGARIAALAQRCGGDAGERIRRYWELQAYLVVEAEETLLEEAGGDAALDRSKLFAAFDELAIIQRSLGRSTFAELQRLLPFSRNDQWEVSELRQRLRKA
jgi:hypothetical protein